MSFAISIDIYQTKSEAAVVQISISAEVAANAEGSIGEKINVVWNGSACPGFTVKSAARLGAGFKQINLCRVNDSYPDSVIWVNDDGSGLGFKGPAMRELRVLKTFLKGVIISS